MQDVYVNVLVLRRLVVFGLKEPQGNDDVNNFLHSVFARIDIFLKSSKFIVQVKEYKM